jgi:hypothetical protein
MEAAKEVSSMLASGKKKLTLRPWNQFNPIDTVWWLVPSTDWPAYQHGKYIFYPNGEFINIGFNVEKGFGLSACKGYPKLANNKLAINQDWSWNYFMEGLRNGEVEERLQEISSIYEAPLQLMVGAGLASDPTDYDPYKTKSDFIHLVYNQGHIQTEDYRCGDGTLENFKKISNISEIPSVLNDLKVLDWVWIDLSISIQFKRYSDRVGAGDKIIDAYDLCRMMEPLDTYVRDCSK